MDSFDVAIIGTGQAGVPLGVPDESAAAGAPRATGPPQLRFEPDAAAP